MAAPFGNQFWKMLEKPGRDKIFSTPDELEQKAIEYFKDIDANPYVYKEYVGKDGDEIEREKTLPYTLEGLCLHLNIDTKTFWNYSKAEGYEAYFHICSRIIDIIRTQKFTGATIGIFNHSIIARDLGLVDKVDTKTDGKQEIIVKYERKRSNTE
jgi:hypothetical protein